MFTVPTHSAPLLVGGVPFLLRPGISLVGGWSVHFLRVSCLESTCRYISTGLLSLNTRSFSGLSFPKKTRSSACKYSSLTEVQRYPAFSDLLLHIAWFAAHSALSDHQFSDTPDAKDHMWRQVFVSGVQRASVPVRPGHILEQKIRIDILVNLAHLTFLPADVQFGAYHALRVACRRQEQDARACESGNDPGILCHRIPVLLRLNDLSCCVTVLAVFASAQGV